MTEQLAYLLPAYGQLPLALIPAKGGGERVRTSRTAPLPLRLDPLSLTADGRTDGDTQDAFIPATQVQTVWRMTPVFEPVDEIGADGQPTGRQLPAYVHRMMEVQERVPLFDDAGRRVLVPAGDQSGVLPLPVWSRAWVLDWRTEFGHSTPAEPALKLRPPPPPPEPQVGAGWVRTDASRTLLLQYLAAIEDVSRRELAADILGLGRGYRTREVRDGRQVRYQPDPDRPGHADVGEWDPSAREWVHRYGQAQQHHALAADVKYLTTWLPEACDRHPDIAQFAAALRALHNAVRHVLGDLDDRMWLGRCPVGHVHDGRPFGREMYDRETGDPVVCGAGLWREPFASMVACPRCGHETPERDLLTLSGWIRAAWPVDRRRKYPLDEVDEIQWATAGKRMGGEAGPPVLRMPLCDDCGGRMGVEWKECTERSDVETGANGRQQVRRMFRVVRLFCPWRSCAAFGGERMSA